MGVVVKEGYPLPSPHSVATGEGAVIPNEAWKSHRVVFTTEALPMTNASVPARTFALLEADYAGRLIERGIARPETDRERQIAIDNGHQRYVGGASKAKPKPTPDPKARRAKPKGDEDGNA